MEGTGKTKWEPINFIYYLSFVKWPVLLAAAVEIAIRIGIAYIWPDFSINVIDLIAWFIRLAAIIYVGYSIGKKFGEIPPMGALAGAMAGLVLGLVGAGFRFASGFRTWKLFNLATETVIMIVVGALVSFLIVYVWDLLPEKIK